MRWVQYQFYFGQSNLQTMRNCQTKWDCYFCNFGFTINLVLLYQPEVHKKRTFYPFLLATNHNQLFYHQQLGVQRGFFTITYFSTRWQQDATSSRKNAPQVGPWDPLGPCKYAGSLRDHEMSARTPTWEALQTFSPKPQVCWAAPGRVPKGAGR